MAKKISKTPDAQPERHTGACQCSACAPELDPERPQPFGHLDVEALERLALYRRLPPRAGATPAERLAHQERDPVRRLLNASILGRAYMAAAAREQRHREELARTANARAARASQRGTAAAELEPQVGRLIRLYGWSDRRIATQLHVDRGAVRRARERLGFTPAKVRDIRDGL